ncbi:FAD-dependent oxidoreductase [Saccharopolyspora taberi]|uniref:Amine oxidase domain-containing protein n=1 Tax=Saccharopolyspora taberi TaxID=60895 RepID=A0ABN3VAR7_9PSEU
MSSDEPDVVHFVCYGNSAGYRPDLPGDREQETEWLEDFLTVAPGLRGRVLGTHVQTWEHCFALLSPERAAAVEDLRRPVGGVHFAGDWTSPTAGTHGALDEAKRVADAVLTGAGIPPRARETC